MATNQWLGKSQARAMVQTITVGGVIELTDSFCIRMQDPEAVSDWGVEIECIVGIDCLLPTPASILDALYDLFNKNEDWRFLRAKCTKVTGGSGTEKLVLTAAEPGIPFKCTAETTEFMGGAADGQTMTLNTTSAADPLCMDNYGPMVYNQASNWSLGHAPTAGEDILFCDTDTGPEVAVHTLAAVTLGNIDIRMSFTGNIGGVAAESAVDFKYSGHFYVGEGQQLEVGSGPGRINAKMMQDGNEVQINNCATKGTDTNMSIVRLSGVGGANSKIYIKKGNVQLLGSKTITELHVSFISSDSDTTIVTESGVTIAKLIQEGGTVTCKGPVTNAYIYAGWFESIASTGFTYALVGQKAKAFFSGSAGMTAFDLSGEADFRLCRKTRAIGNFKAYFGYKLTGYADSLTFPQGITFVGCRPSDGTFDLGQDYKLTPSV